MRAADVHRQRRRGRGLPASIWRPRPAPPQPRARRCTRCGISVSTHAVSTPNDFACSHPGGTLEPTPADPGQRCHAVLRPCAADRSRGEIDECPAEKCAAARAWRQWWKATASILHLHRRRLAPYIRARCRYTSRDGHRGPRRATREPSLRDAPAAEAAAVMESARISQLLQAATVTGFSVPYHARPDAGQGHLKMNAQTQGRQHAT